MRYSGIIIDFPAEETCHAVGDGVSDVIAAMGEMRGGDYSFEFCIGLVWDNSDASMAATLVDDEDHGAGLWRVEGGADIPVPQPPGDSDE